MIDGRIIFKKKNGKVVSHQAYVSCKKQFHTINKPHSPEQ